MSHEAQLLTDSFTPPRICEPYTIGWLAHHNTSRAIIGINFNLGCKKSSDNSKSLFPIILRDFFLAAMGHQSLRARDRWYYFAYGSNMSLQQMAERCPASLLMGKGRIEGYRWQINGRGVANIVKSANDSVEGLVYQVDAKDKRRLDRSEGVARGFYDDEHLCIEFLPLSNPGLKTFHIAKQLEMDDERDPEQGGHQPSSPKSLGPSGAHDAASVTHELSYQSPSRYPRRESLEMVEVIVYVSHEYKKDGQIRPEYVARMERAITDGRKLGLSDSCLNQIDCIIHQDTLPSQTDDAVGTSHSPQQKTENGSTSRDPYEVVASTRSRIEPYEEAITTRPSYPRYVNVITVRPRHQTFDDLDDDLFALRDLRHADDRPHRSLRDTGRRSEGRGQRRDRSPSIKSRQSHESRDNSPPARSRQSHQSKDKSPPTRSRQSQQSRDKSPPIKSRRSRSRDKQDCARCSHRITRRPPVLKYSPRQSVDFHERSYSSPY